MATSDEVIVQCLKVVPNASPNDDGVWRKFALEPEHRKPEGKTMWDVLNNLVDAKYPGHHCVAIQTDLRFADRPGNWWPTP